jgi:hypothetical protein
MITRAVSETGGNNTKPIVKRLQPIEEAVVVREKPLFEFIQEFPSQCAIQWPLYNEENLSFSCWSEFCGYAKVFLRCEVPRLIQLLTPPLLIRPEEKFLYQSAKHFWDKFSLPQSQGPYSVILRSENNTLLGESLEPLLNSDRKQDWSWQRKLVFLLVCVFSSKKFTSMQSSNTEMDPKLSGIVLALLDKIKGPSRGFLPVFSNTHKYKSQLLGSVVHYWEMHYRSKCGGMEIRNPLLNRYPKQEKLYFLLLAHNFLIYYKPQSKEWNNNHCLLGLLRMMFSVQFTSNEDAVAMNWFYWQQQQQSTALTQDLEALFYNAKTINRLIKSNDVTIQWLTEEHKRKDLLKETLDLLTVLPLNSSYIQGVSNAFHTLNKPLQVTPHGTRFLQWAEVKDKLFACLDLQLVFQLSLSNFTIKQKYDNIGALYLLIENQIAQPVYEYYSKMMNLIMNQTGDLPLAVVDIMDPELQRPCTLVVLPNSSYYFIQALSWARWIYVTYSNSYSQLQPDLKSLYALLLGFCAMQEQAQTIQLLIAMLRILLLGHPVEKVAADMEQVVKHTAMAINLFQKNLYQVPKKDSANLHSMFEQNNVCLLRQLSEFAQSTVIVLLLLPWLESSVIKIPKRNHIFLKHILTHWGQNKTSDPIIIQQTKAEVAKILHDLSFDFPAICFKNDEVKELEDLPKQSTAGLGSVEDLLALLDIASKSNVPSLRLMALIGCLVPILPVTREYFNSLFDASSGDIGNDYTEHTSAHSVKWVKITNPLMNQGLYGCDEMIHDLCKVHSRRNSFYFIQAAFIEGRAPKLHKFQQAVLPVYTHNGELMNPLFTSFLQTVPERKHADDNVALKNQLNDKGKNKRRATQQMIPELNLNAIIETTTTDTPPSSSAIELYSPSSPMIEG